MKSSSQFMFGMYAWLLGKKWCVCVCVCVCVCTGPAAALDDTQWHVMFILLSVFGHTKDSYLRR
jgi:hypothetical protein